MLWPATGPSAALSSAAASVESASQTPAQSARQPMLAAIRAAKVHADPSVDGAEIGLLARDAQVTQLERRGNWVRIRIAGEHGAKPQEGWVYSSYLKDAGKH
jgi:hypothetical protein